MGMGPAAPVAAIGGGGGEEPEATVQFADISAFHNSGTAGGSPRTFQFNDLTDQHLVIGVVTQTAFPTTITFDGIAPGGSSGGVAVTLAHSSTTNGGNTFFRWYVVTGVTGGDCVMAWSGGSPSILRACCFQLVGYDTSAVASNGQDEDGVGGSSTTGVTLTPTKGTDAATLFITSDYDSLNAGTDQMTATSGTGTQGANRIQAGYISSSAALSPASVTTSASVADTNKAAACITFNRAA